MKSRLLGAVCAFLFLPSVDAALVDRGGGLIYDDTLDITWLQTPDAGTIMTWHVATSWAAAFTYSDSVRGVTWDGWRLPSLDEYRHNYYVNLGGTLGDNLTGDQGPFINIYNRYWSSTQTSGFPFIAGWFEFSTGEDFHSATNFSYQAWAVLDGDVGAVPIPPAVWLLGSGVIGLIGVARRK